MKKHRFHREDNATSWVATMARIERTRPKTGAAKLIADALEADLARCVS